MPVTRKFYFLNSGWITQLRRGKSYLDLRVCLINHILEFSAETSTQKEFSKYMLSKLMIDCKMKLQDGITLRTKWPYQEKLITGGLVLKSVLKRVQELRGAEMQSHLTSPVNLLLLFASSWSPSLSPFWLKGAVSNHSISSVLIS